MSDPKSKFIDFLRRNGVGPENEAEILADDNINRYQIEGDRGKNATYCLKIDGDFAVGWVHPFRLGETIKYVSRAPSNISEEERAKWRRKIEVEQEEKRKAREALQLDAAKNAQRLVKSASYAENHPYFKAGGLHPERVLVVGELMITPAYDESGQIVNAQTIDKHGNKLFQENAKTRGTYYPIATPGEDKSVLIMCEGRKTGEAIRQATGYPVVVAWNAGNLSHAAKVLRSKYPESRIIIAADNDQWTFKATKKPKGINRADYPGDHEKWLEWRNSDLLDNVGIRKAKQAAAEIGGFVIWPDFDAQDKNKRTDFADADKDMIENRIDQACLASMPEPPASDDSDEAAGGYELPPIDAYASDVQHEVALYDNPEPPEKDDDNWRDKLKFNEDGKLVANSLVNAKLFLENDKLLKSMFIYDEFKHEKYVVQCPPWEKPDNFRPRQVIEEDYTQIACYLENRGCKPGIANIKSLLGAAVLQRRRNPAREYFKKLEWDGEKRLDTWLRDYAGAEFDDQDYVGYVGRKFLVAVVARIFEPGTKFDHMPILEGNQDAGKTMLLRTLGTIHGTCYVAGDVSFLDLKMERKIMHLQGYLIIELAEMAGFDKLSPRERKAVISQQEDRVQQKYRNEVTMFPRQFVFAGTFNPNNSGYLDDVTGERRYWPVRLGSKVDLNALERDKEQLWAEAVHYYRQGEQLYLCEDMRKKLRSVQETRKAIDAWSPYIEEVVASRTTVQAHELWQVLGMDKSRISKYEQDRVGDIMMNLGFTYRRKMFNGVRRPMYVREDAA